MVTALTALDEESSAPGEAKKLASELSFQELLELLLAKQSGVIAENEVLRSEIANLRASHPKGEALDLDDGALRPVEESPKALQTQASSETFDGFLDGGVSRVGSKRSGRSQRSACLEADEEAQKKAGPTTSGEYTPPVIIVLDILEIWGSGAREGTGSASSMVPPTPIHPGLEDSWRDVIRSTRSKHQQFDQLFLESEQIHNCWARLIMPPESRVRMCWDTLGMLLLVFDVLHTPLMVFFDPVSPFERFMALFTTVFWTADICVSFLRGYYRSCVLELRPLQIARHYLLREFVPDVVIITLDWTTEIVETGAASAIGYTRLSKAIRFIRIARILRLVRLVKIPGLLEILENNITDFSMLSFIHISKCMVLIMGTNHFIACAWYYIGSAGATPAWSDVLDQETRSVAYRYATALHWSITQFTPGSMEVQPRNVYERVFAICVIFVGLMMFSSFVSTITSTMTTIRVERAKRHKQRDSVRRYLTENHVSLHVGSRIANFLSSYKFNAHRRVCRDQITLFKALPVNLRLMLDWEVYHPILTSQSFFRQVSSFSPSGMLQICHDGLEEVCTSPCEELFNCGHSAPAMYITLAGSMQYFQGYDELKPREIVGRSHTGISEQALWLKWVHQGRIFALTACDFVRISAKNLKKALLNHPHVITACNEYAVQYRSRITEVLLEFPTESLVGPAEESTREEMDNCRPTINDLFVLNRGIVEELACGIFTETKMDKWKSLAALRPYLAPQHQKCPRKDGGAAAVASV